MKKISCLGLSGSIGQQTLDVCKNNPTQFMLVAFSVGERLSIVEEAIALNTIQLVCVKNESDAMMLQERYPTLRIVWGDEGLLDVATSDCDVVVNALVGFVGLLPTLKAIEAKKDIALANKETLVVAGELIKKAIKEHDVMLLPVDSEHSAIFQCLQGISHDEISKLIITASGGSFRDKTRDELVGVTVKEALSHPNWSMGAKITIDSATMMNKGFEVIEAHYLFDIDYDNIDVVIHQQSAVHSMVLTVDGSILAQCASPDMRLPIQYALTYPRRLPLKTTLIDFSKAMTWNFKPMDYKRFPLLALAIDCGKKKGNLPAVLNAANEVANRAFLDGKIDFLQIEDLVISAVNNVVYHDITCLQDCIDADSWAREFVKQKIEYGG